MKFILFYISSYTWNERFRLCHLLDVKTKTESNVNISTVSNNNQDAPGSEESDVSILEQGTLTADRKSYSKAIALTRLGLVSKGILPRSSHETVVFGI